MRQIVATTLRTCYTYDARGRRIGETRPNADLSSCPATQTGAQPFTSNQRYDAMGRVTGTISADPDGAGGNPHVAVRNSYDGAGRLTKVETGTLSAWQSEEVAPAGWGTAFAVQRTAETQYDAMGRKIREFVREGAAGPVRTMTEHKYDALGRLECSAVRMNPAAFAFAGIPDACLHSAYDAAFGRDRITKTVYDAAGQRLQVREGVGVSGEAGAEATWAYNANGQVTTVIDANGNRAELRYDGHARQDRWTFPSTTRPGAYDDSTQASALATAGAVNASDYEEYGYDPNSNRTSLRKRDTTTLTYQYDALNRVTLKIVPERPAPHPYPLTAAQTRDVHYGYDLRGLQLFARFDSQAGPGVVNTYDGFGRLTSHSINMGGTTRTLGYQYDRNGNRTRITHPDSQYFTFDVDALNRFTGINQSGNSDVLTQYHRPAGERSVIGRGLTGTGYHYDGFGRLALFGHNFADHNLIWTYAYNSAGQVASSTRDNDAYAWTGHYAVDRAYLTDGLNRYTAAGPPGNPGQGANFAYDANGNLISDGTRTFAYDVENRLVGASGGVQLGYDPLGRLAWTTGSPNFTWFLYDPGSGSGAGADALVAEYDYGGNLLRRYVHGGRVDEPFLLYEGSGVAHANLRLLFADRQGSIVGVTDYWGNSIAINRYDEYGIPAATNSGRFQYTGQIWLPELGMYHYKARVYSPSLGRFMQTDPVGYEGGINLYAYVGNDPINFIDQSGAQAIPVPGCVGCHTTSGPARQSPVTVPLPTLPDPSRALGVLACVMNPLMCAQTIGEQVGQALMSDGRFTGDEVIIDDHIADSLGDRGWTEEGVRGLTETDPTGTSTDNRTVDGERLDDPSTVYGSAQGGYVVVNDRTGEVVQVSDRTDGNWRPDPRISWKDEVRRR